MSDINDRYLHDDSDVIEIKQATDSTSIALVPVVDLTRVAANINRVADVDRDGGAVVAANAAAPPSSASKALALMMMFDLDREPL